MACAQMAQDPIWFDKWRFDDAEKQHFERQSKPDTEESSTSDICKSFDRDTKKCEPVIMQGERAGLGLLATQIAKARQEIQDSLCKDKVTPVPASCPSSNKSSEPDIVNRVANLELENTVLKKAVSSLEQTVNDLSQRIQALSIGGQPTVKSVPKPEPVTEEDDDDDVDLFGSDDEDDDADAARIKEERIKAYADKKSKKPGPIAKSSILLDIKPWDDETDMKETEKIVRSIEMDGLVWGAGELRPLAYGIMKLSILCTIEDEKVSVDDLSEKIQDFEDMVQSVDIAAFNKV